MRILTARLRIAAFAAVFLLLSASPAAHAAGPGGDVYLGYSYLGNNAFNPGTGSLNGWQAAVHIHWVPLVGVELDVAHYGLGGASSIQHITTVLVGPRVTVGAHGVNVFAHGMFGWENSANAASGASSISGGGPTLAVGGGADFRLASFFAWRVTVDYINAPTSSPAGNHSRFGTGAVFRF
jgi:hypothetical protein